jgi:hypothetical protein
VKIFVKNNVNGILGTVVFHLALLTMFLSFKVAHNPFKVEVPIEIEFEQSAPEEKIRKILEPDQPVPDYLDVIADGVIRRNIAVNVTEKVEDEISTDKFIDQFTNENKLEGFRTAMNPSQEPQNADESGEETIQVKDSSKQIKKQPTNTIYKGPTTITYELEGRKIRYYPIPVYTCQGAGKVVVEIYVNQNGEVVSSSVIKEESVTDDDCLYPTAAYYASKTLFNTSGGSPQKQKGRLIYQFQSQ